MAKSKKIRMGKRKSKPTHQPFESTASAISAEQDIHSVQSLVRSMPKRLLIADTDDGEALRGRIDDLMALIAAYRSGVIKEMRG